MFSGRISGVFLLKVLRSTKDSKVRTPRMMSSDCRSLRTLFSLRRAVARMRTSLTLIACTFGQKAFAGSTDHKANQLQIEKMGGISSMRRCITDRTSWRLPLQRRLLDLHLLELGLIF